MKEKITTSIYIHIVKVLVVIACAFCMLLSAGTTVHAKAAKNGWVKQDGYYCYLQNGKKKTGFIDIGEKKYLFDNKGRQQTGWRKVGKDARYFAIENGKNGYMVVNKSVNGLSLDKGGNVKNQSNSDVKTKMNLLLNYQTLADKVMANKSYGGVLTPDSSKSKKLEKMFLYAKARQFMVYPDFSASKHWDYNPAMMFVRGASADCVVSACGFAYLANAVGYKDVKLLLYGHSHCEINGLAYDPAQAKNAGNNWKKFYGKTYSQLPGLAPYKNKNPRYV